MTRSRDVPPRPVAPLIGAVQLSMYDEDGAWILGATGSLIRDEQPSPLESRSVLVTALHCVTGCDPYTGSPVLPAGRRPARIGVRVLSKSKSDPEERLVDLYDEVGRGVWLESDEGPKDIAGLDVTELVRGTSAPVVDRFDEPLRRPIQTFLDADVRVGDQLILAAFPYGRRTLELFPLMLQALLASDLDGLIGMSFHEEGGQRVEDDFETGFVIDCAAAGPGCDGGLVYLYQKSWRTKSGFTVGLDYRAPIPLGMYVGSVDAETTLGRVMPLRAVSEVARFGRQTSTERPRKE